MRLIDADALYKDITTSIDYCEDILEILDRQPTAEPRKGNWVGVDDEPCDVEVRKMGSELCKTCIHTKVCMHDKNLIGDVFVMGHPMFFDNDKLYEEYKERKKQGFPCEDYMSTTEPKKGRWTKENACEFCGYMPWYERDIHTLNFCPNCGADMRGEEE